MSKYTSWTLSYKQVSMALQNGHDSGRTWAKEYFKLVVNVRIACIEPRTLEDVGEENWPAGFPRPRAKHTIWYA